MVNYFLVVTSIALAVAGQLLMKRGMLLFGTFPVSQLLFKILPIFLNPFVFLGLICFGLSSISFVRASACRQIRSRISRGPLPPKAK